MTRKKNKNTPYRFSFRLTLLGLCILYGALFFSFQSLQFPIEKDEIHFWQTSLWFDGHVLGSPHWITSLRTYDEQNTPLPFIIYALCIRLFHNALFVSRLINFILSFFVMFIMLRPRTPIALMSAFGLLLFPYFIFVSTHVYTDMLAIFFALLGIVCHRHKKYIGSILSFACAISSRQYMVVFPAVLFIYEFMAWLPVRKKNLWHIAWISPLIAAFTLCAWIIFFGGLETATALHNKYAYFNWATFYPQHALYYFACIGVYYVIPEYLFFSRKISFRNTLACKKNIVIALVLGMFFIVFPPLNNVAAYNIPTMGLLDKTVRLLGNDVLRMVIFYLCALLCCIRFLRIELASLFVFVYAILMLKALIGWDKYALPIIMILWYLKALGRAGYKPGSVS